MRMRTLTVALLALAPTLAARADLVIDFEDIAVPPGSYLNGDPGGLQPGDEITNTFVSRGAGFNNVFGIDPAFGFPYWTGWAISRVEDDTTPGFGNQYASYAGGGFGGSGTYGVAFDNAWIDLPTLGFTPIAFSAQITNTTYAALSMLNGDDFSPPLGGIAGGGGSVADFVLLRITGYSGAGATGSELGQVDFYLADYRFTDNSQDYIVKDWATVDLSSLLGAQSLGFEFLVSDALIDPVFGPTVPLYFALDNLTFATAVVPEPSSLALLALGASSLALAVRRRQHTG